jgi:hypothetical protein
MARRAVLRVGLGAAMFAALGAGCSVIVGGDVPDFSCASTSKSACPSGLTCDVATGRCVADAGYVPGDDAGEEDADPADAPDARTDGDASGPAALGSPCRVDGDCQSKLCGTSTHLTTVITQTTGPICTTPCCTSTDCAAPFVCFNGGTGGGYCVPPALAQRATPGAKQAGATCASNAECRSGLCQTRCLDTCCANSDCAAGSICRVKTTSLLQAATPTHDVWVCAAATGTLNLGDACTNQTDCKTEMCIPSNGGVCRPPCSNTQACKNAGYANGHCLYSPSGADFLHYCLFTTNGSDIATGGSCVDHGDCQSDFCDPETKKCAEVCAKNADCPATQECRPSAVGTPYLRCVTKR